MSKIVQRSASAALRMRTMSSDAKLSADKVADFGSKLNPAQGSYGPKDPAIEKWQKFFQDPINVEKPVYRRKGFTDDMIVSGLSATIAAIFIYNVGDFIFGS